VTAGSCDDPQPVQHVLGLVHNRVLHDDLISGQGMGDAASNDQRAHVDPIASIAGSQDGCAE